MNTNRLSSQKSAAVARKVFLMMFPVFSIYKMESMFLSLVTQVPALLLGSWFVVSYYYYFWHESPKRKPAKIGQAEHHAHIVMWTLFISALLSNWLIAYVSIPTSVIEGWMLLLMVIGAHHMYTLIKYRHNRLRV